jgi:exodeoxyribonuclease-3
VDWLERENPDILCLQETKVQDKDFPVSAFEEMGYNVLVRGQKAYNGVAILTTLPLKNSAFNFCEQGDEQARFVSATVGQVPLINVYVPQGFATGTEKFAYKLRWLRNLKDHIDQNYHPSQPLLTAGDFNVALEDADVYDPEGFRGQVGFHPEERALMRDLLGWGLVDLFRQHEPEGRHYTFWDYRIPNGFKRNMGWRIDYILATEPLAARSRSAWVDTAPRTAPKPSDHTFLVAEFDLEN